MIIKAAGISDVGLKRDSNEDSFSINDSLGLYIVADGMGGHLAGEIASKVSVEMINKSFQKWKDEDAAIDEIYGSPDSSLSNLGNYLRSAIKLANRVVYEMASEQEQHHGMGTTVAIILITPTLLISANVGDSRIYLIRDNKLEALSKDHSIVAEQVEMGLMTEEEAERSPMKHILTRNLGSSENVIPDIFEIEPANNDRLVLCSDGLTDLVNGDEILEMTLGEKSPDILCRKFIDTVLNRGAHDNTTIISILISGINKSHKGPIKMFGMIIVDLIAKLQKTINKIFP